MHHESFGLINHTDALSVRHAGYQCLCTSLAAWSIVKGGWGLLAEEAGIFIFLSRGHLLLRATENDVVMTCTATICLWSGFWRQAGCAVSSVGSCQCHYSNWRLYRKPKIGAAKSSINKTRESWFVRLYFWNPSVLSSPCSAA